MKTTIIKQARKLLNLHPLFLDTETTGLDRLAEIVEIAIVDDSGQVLLNSLVRPTCPISPEAQAIHGISIEHLADAPNFADLYDQLTQLLRDRTLAIYNAHFDLSRLRASAFAHDLKDDFDMIPFDSECIMQMFAAYYGDWDPRRRSYRWQSLANAARACGAKSEGTPHRALYDAQITRQVLLHMAAQPVEETQP